MLLTKERGNICVIIGHDKEGSGTGRDHCSWFSGGIEYKKYGESFVGAAAREGREESAATLNGKLTKLDIEEAIKDGRYIFDNRGGKQGTFLAIIPSIPG